jgi:hypothetical protein
MFTSSPIGSPQNTFQSNYQTQSQPKNMMLGNALQNYGAGNQPQAAYGPTQQYNQQSNQNYAMPGGQGQAPYGFNAYAQGLNKSTGMQPQLPQPLQSSQSPQY